MRPRALAARRRSSENNGEGTGDGGRDFEGFVVVVTGASTGLGRAIAVETAERGAGRW
jgi:predicted RNA-binding protein with TRAM domain